MDMGPALENKNIISFLGVKGGVGCSILTSLLGRVLSKKQKWRIGLIDSLPPPYSAVPSYLSISHPQHSLFQLLPYQDHLTSRTLENYFPASPEGISYISTAHEDESRISPAVLFPLLGKLSPWFDLLFIDLSGFPNDQHLPFLEKSSSVFLISSFEASSVKAVQDWEKRLLPLHLPLQDFNVVFNHQNPSQTPSKDPQSWSKYFHHFGSVPFLGENLSMALFENGVLTPSIEKNIESLSDQFAANAREKSIRRNTGPSANRISSGGNPVPLAPEEVSLEQVNQLHQKLLEELRTSGALKDPKYFEASGRQALEPTAKSFLDRLIQEMRIPDRETRQKLLNETLNLAFGLGPLEPYLQDEAVTEIMVNGPHQIYVEKKGLLEKTSTRFLDDQQLRTIIERILAPIGRRIDESQPYVDGRLADGSRVNAVIPPLSLTGPLLTIRKFSKRKLKAEDLINLDSITREAADFLGACVRAKKNIVVSGGTGSGKTTLLNILSNYIPPDERIVTIEDSAELQLSQDHVITLESRPANLEGKGRVSIRDLVINALRMRPDRIVVGECRGEETLDMLQAMNTGHDGSLTTAHANSPRDVLSRLETMALFSGLELPLRAIREQIARAVHLIVQQSRLPGGKRAVTQITEIQGMEGDVIITQDLFRFETERGLVRRSFAPAFLGDLQTTGYQWPGHNEKLKS